MRSTSPDSWRRCITWPDEYPASPKISSPSAYVSSTVFAEPPRTFIACKNLDFISPISDTKSTGEAFAAEELYPCAAPQGDWSRENRPAIGAVGWYVGHQVCP